jgi:3-phenylpropionate/trans-cinnamate dioxygenase ferredoxin reductase component
VTREQIAAGHAPDVDVLIAGTGHGAAQAAIALRHKRFAGTIALVGAEPELPYERPPLTKQYLSGAKGADAIRIRSEAFWSEQQIALYLGSPVVALEVAGRTAVLRSGQCIGYRHLVWAAGGRPRQLTCAGHGASGVHTIRHRVGVDRLREQLATVQRVVIVGAGYIGLEAAATLVKQGKQVTVIEACDRVLARVAGEPLSAFYQAQHRQHGVDVRVGATVHSVEEHDGHATGVRLETGEVLKAPVVIVGIGIQPEVEVLAQAGARVTNGVVVDETCRTTLPDVFAIGDCALHPNHFAEGRSVRLESVQNATDQAVTVASVLTGQPAMYRSVPWFWSEQYDLRLQTVGLAQGFDEMVVRGEPTPVGFSVVYLRQGAVIALDCMNATRDFVQGKALVQNRCRPDPSRLADPAVPLKTLA